MLLINIAHGNVCATRSQMNGIDDAPTLEAMPNIDFIDVVAISSAGLSAAALLR